MIERSSRWAWAIDPRSQGGHGLIGWGWFKPPAMTYYPSVPGIALFETRRVARERLANVTRNFPRARVVRVRVSIESRE